MRKLTPDEELRWLREIHGPDSDGRMYDLLVESFHVLQTRSQVVMGLVTICLTITGFSGPQIAASSVVARNFVFLGVLLVLASAVCTILGPLQIRWITRYRLETVDSSLIALLARRNQRTTAYHASVLCLLLGLTGYVISFAAFLLEH